MMPPPTAIDVKLDNLGREIEELKTELRSDLRDLRTILRGAGDRTGLVGRIESLEADRTVSVAKIQAAAHISAAKIAVLGAVSGGIAGAVGALLAVVFGA